MTVFKMIQGHVYYAVLFWTGGLWLSVHVRIHKSSRDRCFAWKATKQIADVLSKTRWDDPDDWCRGRQEVEASLPDAFWDQAMIEMNRP